MKLRLILAACALAAAISCKKNTTDAPVTPEVPVKMEKVKITLTGDIITSTESPLGRKAYGNGVYARTLKDSTIYMVHARAGVGYFGGVFTDPDDIELYLPAPDDYGGNLGISIYAYAFRRGTGPGMYYTWENGIPAFGKPVYSSLRNNLEPAYFKYVDTIAYMRITSDQDTSAFVTYENPQIDAFRGDSSWPASAYPQYNLTVRMKRISYGVEFSSSNFTSGSMTVFFDDAEPLNLTPATISSVKRIYACDSLKSQNTQTSRMWILWNPGNGNSVPIGEKYITFKRNVSTKIHITIPPQGPQYGEINPIIVDTAWNGNETINF